MLPLMVVKSPRCDELVTLPAGLSPEARVRCPFTKEEFQVQEILDSLPPMLEILDPGPGAAAGLAGATAAAVEAEGADTPAPGDAATATAVEEPSDAAVAETGEPADAMFGFLHGEGEAKAEDKDAEPKDAGGTAAAALFEPAEDGGAATAGAFDFASAEAATVEETTAKSATAEAPARRKARPRPKKKPKNAVAEIIKVVLGGVAGLVIAQLILWWLPGSWRRDPADLAPKLPGFLSWAAPASLRNPELVPDQPANGGPSSGSSNAGANDQQPVARDDPEVLETPFPVPGGGEPTTPGSGSDGSEIAAVTEPKDGGGGGDPDDLYGATGIDDPIEDPGEDPPMVEEVLGVRRAPVYSGTELGEALKTANEAAETVATAGGLDLSNQDGRVAGVACYKAFCELAERATFVDQEGEQVPSRMAAIEGILLDLCKRKKSLDAIGQLASTWLTLEQDKRSSGGIMLAGTVVQISAQGKLFHTEVRLFQNQDATADGQPIIVSVMSRNDPRDKFDAGDRVVVLGTLVDEPSLNLGGYEGNLPLVVWGGYPVVLPKAGGGAAAGARKKRPAGGGN